MSTEFFSSIYINKIKDEITPYDYTIRINTKQRGYNGYHEPKLYDVQIIKIMRRDVPYLIEQLQELKKKENIK